MSKKDPLIGTQIDEYKIITALGEGAMARIYQAEDVRLGRQVAIKVIDPPMQENPDYVMRFEREARAIARLEHPHIVRLYRFGEVEGMLYMAMQYVQGATLEFLIEDYRLSRRKQPNKYISFADVLRIMDELCKALDFAHSHQVVHRDVKPSNIMLDKQGNVMLADFGIVLLGDVGTHGEVFGTPHYIAPEQAISSAQASPASDLYSVGIIAYEMLSGYVPFDGEDPMGVAMMHLTETAPPLRQARPTLDPMVESVVLKMMSRDATLRYPTGAAFVDALGKSLR